MKSLGVLQVKKWDLIVLADKFLNLYAFACQKCMYLTKTVDLCHLVAKSAIVKLKGCKDNTQTSTHNNYTTF